MWRERSSDIPRSNSRSIEGPQMDPELQSVKAGGDPCYWSGMHIIASKSLLKALKGFIWVEILFYSGFISLL